MLDGVLEIDEPAVNYPLGLKSFGKFGGWDAHLLCRYLDGDDTERHHITFVCIWTSFHSVSQIHFFISSIAHQAILSKIRNSFYALTMFVIRA